jgi:ferredoxin
VEDKSCNGCSICEKLCPVGAIKMEKGLAGVNKLGKLARVNKEYCIGCGVCATKCKPKSVQLHSRAKRVITPEDTFEKTILQSLQRGTMQNLIFDNPMSVSHSFMRAFIGGFLRLSPVKKALMSDTLRSRFLYSMKKGVQSQGQSWITKM